MFVFQNQRRSKSVRCYDATASGGTYSVKIGSQSLSGTVKAGKAQSESLGDVDLGAGNYEISVVADKIVGEDLMNLRTITMSP